MQPLCIILYWQENCIPNIALMVSQSLFSVMAWRITQSWERLLKHIFEGKNVNCNELFTEWYFSLWSDYERYLLEAHSDEVSETCMDNRHWGKKKWCIKNFPVWQKLFSSALPWWNHYVFPPMFYFCLIDIVGIGALVQWNLSATTTSIMKFIACDLFSNVFNWRVKLPIYSKWPVTRKMFPLYDVIMICDGNC